MNTGENYEYWCAKMKIVLFFKDAWDIVGNGYIEPHGWTLLSNNFKKTKEEEMKNDDIALVEDSIYPKIVAASTIKEAWEILGLVY